jgi:pSer/pThr/pTyr-binding forkhead associated (FHA) protein
MAVTLRVRSGSSSESGPTAPAITFDLPRVVLGRGEGCDLRVPDLSISHRNASIRQRGAEYILLDEGSTNGTFLGSVRLCPQSPRVLRDQELVRIGRVWVEVIVGQAAPTAQPAQATRELALALVARALQQQGESARPRLVVIEGPDLGKRLDFVEPMRPLIVGRGREADLPLELTDASRRHAQLMRKGDQLLVRDLGSRNGTHTEAGPVPMDRDAVLKPGDKLLIGPDVFVFEHPAVQALKELERAIDEPLDARDAPAPPEDIAPLPPNNASAHRSAPSAPGPVSQSAAPPVTAAGEPQAPGPTAEPGQTAGRSRSGWTKTDVIVVLLALIVLALSCVGLFWLFNNS